MKKLILPLLLIGALGIYALPRLGGGASGRPIVPCIEPHVTQVEVTQGRGPNADKYVLMEEDVDALRTWCSSLEWVALEVEENTTPWDGREVDIYEFVPRDSAFPGFSYYIVGPDEHYFYVEGYLRAVIDPTPLPLHTPGAPPPPGDPPYQVGFHGPEDLEEFLAADQLSDGELQAFLTENGYTMNGVSTREDVQEISSWFTQTPIPAVTQGVLSDITLYVETRVIFVRYEGPEGAVFTFRYAPDRGLVSPEDLESRWTLSDLSTDALQIYQPNTKDADDPAYSYYLVTPETAAVLRLFYLDPARVKDCLKLVTFQ